MSWNKNKISFFNSLRFRSALLAVTLFLLFSVLSFFALLYFYSGYSRIAAETELASAIDSILCVYLTGQKAERLGVRIPWEQMPESLVQKAGSLHKNFQPIFFFISKTRKERIYSIVGASNRKYFLVAVSAGGRLISSRQLNPDRNIAELQKSFPGYLEYTRKGIFFRLSNEKGGTLAGAASPMALKVFKDGGNFYMVQSRELYNGKILDCAYSLYSAVERKKQLFSTCCLIFLGLLPAWIFSGWLVAAYVTRGLKDIRSAAVKISAGDLAHRIRNEERFTGGEVRDLVEVFNKMSANNESLVTELRTVTDDIAHDLRTPLTRIRGTAELAVMKCSSNSCRDAFGSIAEECDNMISIIGDMLEISRSEAGLRKPQKTLFSLNTLLEKLFDIYRMNAEELGQTWKINLPEKEIMIRADALNLQRVFSNLLDNAAKFMAEGNSLTLSVTEEEMENKIKIFVADTGPGIPDDCKEKVFKRFFRMDSSRSTSGNGLGLALVAAIIHAHGGTIHVEDTPGGGATFVIGLPLE